MSADSAAGNNEVIAFSPWRGTIAPSDKSLIGTAALSGNDFSSGL